MVVGKVYLRHIVTVTTTKGESMAEKLKYSLPHLREWRAQRVLTQRELAERSGVDRIAILRLETGKTQAIPATVAKLAKALGISREQLVREAPPGEPTERQAERSAGA